MHWLHPHLWIGPAGVARLRSRSASRPALLAALALTAALTSALALMSTYVGVVREAVHQSEMRREAVATHAAATWRCRALKGAALREDCLQQLNRPAPQSDPMARPGEQTASIRP